MSDTSYQEQLLLEFTDAAKEYEKIDEEADRFSSERNIAYDTYRRLEELVLLHMGCPSAIQRLQEENTLLKKMLAESRKGKEVDV